MRTPAARITPSRPPLSLAAPKYYAGVDMDDYIELARSLAGGREERPRGGPRSKLVDAIMLLLLSKPMRSAEIAGILGLQSKYVASYLSYWKARGYVAYDAGFWYLTPRGEEYAQTVLERVKREASNELEVYARRMVSERRVKGAVNDKTGAAPPEGPGRPQSFIAGKTGLPGSERQDRGSRVVCALTALKGQLDDDEFEVVNVLLLHYAKWGSTYMYLDQLQERMQADYQWLMRIVRRLQAKNVVYIYSDPRLGIRVGLSRRLKEYLEACG